MRSAYIVGLAATFKLQLGCFGETERCVMDGFSVLTDGTDNGNRIIHDRSDHRLFLVNTNFVISDIGSTGTLLRLQRLTQIDYIFIGPR